MAVRTVSRGLASESASCCFSWALSGLSVCCSRPCAVAREASASWTAWRAESEIDAREHLALVDVLALLDEQLRERPLVWKLAATSPAEATLPLAETEVMTTPRCTVAVRVAALEALDEPSVL